MQLIFRLLAVMTLVLAVSACGTYRSIKTGERVDVGKSMTVEVVGAWSAVNSNVIRGKKPGALWTIDGLTINRLTFLDGIADGEQLLTTGNETRDKDVPAFRAGMTEAGIAELLEATLIRTVPAPLVKSRDLRPAAFGRHEGFAFHLDIVTESQLEIGALAAGAVVDGKLYLMLYMAPRLHFFDRQSPTVEAIARTVQIGT